MNKAKEKKENDTENKIKKKAKIISKKDLILILIAIFLIIIGVLMFFLLENYRSSKKNDNNFEEANKKEDVSLMDYGNMNNAELINGEKKNTSEVLLKERTFKGLKVKDIKLEEIKGFTSFSAKLENITDDDFENCIIVLIFTNEDGTEYARLEASIPDIPKGKTTILDTSTTSDLTNAFDFKIEEI